MYGLLCAGVSHTCAAFSLLWKDVGMESLVFKVADLSDGQLRRDSIGKNIVLQLCRNFMPSAWSDEFDVNVTWSPTRALPDVTVTEKATGKVATINVKFSTPSGRSKCVDEDDLRFSAKDFGSEDVICLICCYSFPPEFKSLQRYVDAASQRGYTVNRSFNEGFLPFLSSCGFAFFKRTAITTKSIGCAILPRKATTGRKAKMDVERVLINGADVGAVSEQLQHIIRSCLR